MLPTKPWPASSQLPFLLQPWKSWQVHGKWVKKFGLEQNIAMVLYNGLLSAGTSGCMYCTIRMTLLNKFINI